MKCPKAGCFTCLNLFVAGFLWLGSTKRIGFTLHWHTAPCAHCCNQLRELLAGFHLCVCVLHVAPVHCTPPAVSCGLAHRWVSGTLQTLLLCFAEKMAFVGFKGSFRPVWVRLVTSEDSAKIYQALPIPVVKKMKLWGHLAVPAGRQHCPWDGRTDGWTDCCPLCAAGVAFWHCCCCSKRNLTVSS